MFRRLVTVVFAGALCLGATTPVSAQQGALGRGSEGVEDVHGRRVEPVRVQVRRISSNPEHRCPRLEPMIQAYGLPVQAFSFLAWRESKCVRKAVGWNYHRGMGPQDCPSGLYEKHRRCAAVRSHDLGAWQINSSWRTVTRRLCAGTEKFDISILFDLDCNLKVAKYLYENGGLAHWSITG